MKNKKNRKAKKIAVVTGGAGFIGSHLCDFLIRKNFKVICVDNFITGDERNIAHLMGHPDFQLKKLNITKHFEIEGRVDFVLHFASPASPVDYLKYPIQTLKVGALGTHNCLGLAKAKKAKFLLASTSEIYGDPQEHPQKEAYWGHVNPIGSRAVYDEAKRFAEAITMAYHRNHAIDTKIIRIFNTYGPRMRHNDGRVVPNFIIQALKGEPLSVYGEGLQTRSFCFVSDLIAGIYKLMNVRYNEPVNLGNPVEVTVKEFAKIIIALTKSASKIVHVGLPTQDDPKKRKPDISRAKRYLKWKPCVRLEDGLQETIRWFSAKVASGV